MRLTLTVAVGFALIGLAWAVGESRARGDAARAARPTPTIRFAASRSRLTITTRAYELTLSRRNGALLGLVDRSSGRRLLRGSSGCLWAAAEVRSSTPIGGCLFAPRRPLRFRHRWDRATTTLTLVYEVGAGAARAVGAVAQVRASASAIDLSLSVENGREGTLGQVVFPADLVAATADVEAAYATTYLPGIRLKPSFFAREASSVATYPSRWAFADYLALDFRRAHLALYAVNPAPGPLHPVTLGFVHRAAPENCSGPSFCVIHAFETWIRPRETWRSPTVRLRIGGNPASSIGAYRRDNGIAAYPSLARKLGSRLETLARAPLIKADLWKGLPPFRDWAAELRRVPSPALIHPVSFQPGGHDESFPDFLPPDPAWGTSAEFQAAAVELRAQGKLLMPYLNISWWDDESPTLRALPSPLLPRDVAVLDEEGNPVVQHYSGRSGYVVSPFAPFVRERLGRLIEQWRTEVRADCLFFDQIGARPWLRDFNPTAASALAYGDGWLAAIAPYADRCLMVEDGWDRLADSATGFHGGLMMAVREAGVPDANWGEGTWEPYPLATWLLHDKVLLYQHDLFEGTMTADTEILTWNLAFGLVLSYNWDGVKRTLESPWLERVSRLQRLLGPHYVGRTLDEYRRLAPDVTESVFGDLSVIANWSSTGPYMTDDGYGVAPQGFLARTGDGSVTAGTFTERFAGERLSPGVHYLIVERGG